MATFGERLKKLREGRELSQLELATRFNLSQSTIAYYEKNKKQPNQTTLQKMADFFSVSVDYLLGRTDEVHEAPYDYREDPDLTDEVKKILDRVATLTPEQQALFFEHIKITLTGLETQNRSSEK